MLACGADSLSVECPLLAAMYCVRFPVALVILLLVAIVLGILNGVGFLYSEFQNNNNGEYYDILTGAVDWPYAALTLMIAAVPTFGLAFVLEFFLYQVSRSIVRRTPI
jgi:hypothetical protein